MTKEKRKSAKATKPARKRAMESGRAQEVKVSGHKNEHEFAKAIGGQVHEGGHTDKRDVIDKQHYSHSVKAGKWWQIFLYGEERLRTNTVLQALGNVATCMVKCLRVYPQTFAEYQADKARYKEALRAPMRKLKKELTDKAILKAFLEKAMFEGGNAEYLSIYPGPAKDPLKKKHFHIFHRDDVVRILGDDLTPLNSQVRKPGDTAEQKVVFKSTLHGKQIGEIEDRHDSPRHYREMKFRVNGLLILETLQKANLKSLSVNRQVTAYGYAATAKRFGKSR